MTILVLAVVIIAFVYFRADLYKRENLTIAFS